MKIAYLVEFAMAAVMLGSVEALEPLTNLNVVQL